MTEPVLSHDSTAVFFDSLKNETVHWKKADVFNPAAIVRNDTIYVLSRCEDNPAAILGGRTSRIGISASLDGIHFTSFSEPVLYPAKDSFSNMIIPEVVKIPASFKLKRAYMYLLILPGIIKYPVYRLHFQKIFFIGRKKGLLLLKHITTSFWTRPANQLP